jgi:hypothetical protein
MRKYPFCIFIPAGLTLQEADIIRLDEDNAK